VEGLEVKALSLSPSTSKKKKNLFRMEGHEKCGGYRAREQR
jgi:hypothetical protein